MASHRSMSMPVDLADMVEQQRKELGGFAPIGPTLWVSMALVAIEGMSDDEMRAAVEDVKQRRAAAKAAEGD